MLTKQWDKAEAEGRELMKPEYGFELVPEYKDIFTLANERTRKLSGLANVPKDIRNTNGNLMYYPTTIISLLI